MMFRTAPSQRSKAQCRPRFELVSNWRAHGPSRVDALKTHVQGQIQPVPCDAAVLGLLDHPPMHICRGEIMPWPAKSRMWCAYKLHRYAKAMRAPVGEAGQRRIRTYFLLGLRGCGGSTSSVALGKSTEKHCLWAVSGLCQPKAE